jgi:hypothetical protein
MDGGMNTSPRGTCRVLAHQVDNERTHPPIALHGLACALSTVSKQQHYWSEAQIAVGLKIIQVQVGHECDSSTAIYTHVSDDFMSTALRKALAPAFEEPERGKDQR